MNNNIKNLQEKSIYYSHGENPLLNVHKFIYSILIEGSEHLRAEAELIKSNKATLLIPGATENDFANYMGLNRAATCLQNANITVTSPLEVLRSLPIETLAEKILDQCSEVLKDEARKCRKEGSPTSEKVASGIEFGISLIQSHFKVNPNNKLKI